MTQPALAPVPSPAASTLDLTRYPKTWQAVRSILFARARDAAAGGELKRPTPDQIEAAAVKAIEHMRGKHARILELPVAERVVACTSWLPHALEAAYAAFGEDVTLGWQERMGAGQKPDTHEIVGYVRVRPSDPTLYAVVRRREQPCPA